MSADGELHNELACRGRGEIWILRFHIHMHKQEKIVFGGKCECNIDSSGCAHVDWIDLVCPISFCRVDIKYYRRIMMNYTENGT